MEVKAFSEEEEEALEAWCLNVDFDHVLGLSVSDGQRKAALEKMLGEEIALLHPGQQLPFNNLYESPNTLGMDRLAAVAGAWSRKPDFCSLVIDIGTALTYDLIDEKGRYTGGGISPGLALRCRALHTFTAKLPLVDHNIPVSSLALIGQDTVNSIRSGVLHGTAAEIDGMIARYKAEYPGCLVWLTGGDAALFAGCLKSQIFAAPNLVLEGLNSILNCNVANPS